MYFEALDLGLMFLHSRDKEEMHWGKSLKEKFEEDVWVLVNVIREKREVPRSLLKMAREVKRDDAAVKIRKQSRIRWKGE